MTIQLKHHMTQRQKTKIQYQQIKRSRKNCCYHSCTACSFRIRNKANSPALSDQEDIYMPNAPISFKFDDTILVHETGSNKPNPFQTAKPSLYFPRKKLHWDKKRTLYSFPVPKTQVWGTIFINNESSCSQQSTAASRSRETKRTVRVESVPRSKQLKKTNEGY